MNQRTKPVTLILLAVVGAAIGWVLEIWIVGSGWPMFVPPLTMPITLAVVAVVLLVLAWPVRTYTRALRRQRDAREARGEGAGDDDDFGDPRVGGSRAGAGGERGSGGGDRRRGDGSGGRDRRDDDVPPKRVDPVYAVRVLAFAKASSLAGAVLAGGTAAVFVFVLTRPVIAQGLLPESIAGVVGAVVLLVAGLVAESWCLLPPDSRDARRAAAPSRPVLGA